MHAKEISLDALVVGVIVLSVCLFGIWTRPLGSLAVFWPANALLLGLFCVSRVFLQCPGGLRLLSPLFLQI